MAARGAPGSSAPSLVLAATDVIIALGDLHTQILRRAAVEGVMQDVRPVDAKALDLRQDD
jgi:hypothetical protein